MTGVALSARLRCKRLAHERAIPAVLALISLTAALTACSDVERAAGRVGSFDEALRTACASGKIVPASDLISAEWDRLLIVSEYTTGDVVNRLLGFRYTSDDSYYGYLHTGFLLDGEKPVVEFMYDRGENASPAQLPEAGRVFDVSSLAVVPISQASPEVQAILADRNQTCVLSVIADDGASGAAE